MGESKGRVGKDVQGQGMGLKKGGASTLKEMEREA